MQDIGHKDYKIENWFATDIKVDGWFTKDVAYSYQEPPVVTFISAWAESSNPPIIMSGSVT